MLQDLTDEQKKQSDREKWQSWLEMYKTRLEKECEGLKEDEIEELSRKRKELMNSTNPRFILRNYIAQNAIEAAENGNYSEVRDKASLVSTSYKLLKYYLSYIKSKWKVCIIMGNCERSPSLAEKW